MAMAFSNGQWTGIQPQNPDPMTTPGSGGYSPEGARMNSGNPSGAGTPPALPMQNVSTANNTGGGDPNIPWNGGASSSTGSAAPAAPAPAAAPAAPTGGMSKDQAQQILSSGVGDLAAAQKAYYGTPDASNNMQGGSYWQNKSVQTAATPQVEQQGNFNPQNPQVFGAGAFNAPGGYNPNSYATQGTAQQLQQMYGGNLAQANSGGPFGNANAPQLNLESHGIMQNAGALAANINMYGADRARQMHDAELAMNPSGGQQFASGAANFSEVGDRATPYRGDTGMQDFSHPNQGNGATMAPPSMSGFGGQGGGSMYGQGNSYGMPSFQPQQQGTQYGGFNSWGSPQQGNPFASMTYGQQQYNPMQSGQQAPGSQSYANLLNNMNYQGGGNQGPVAWGQQANPGLFYPSFY